MSSKYVPAAAAVERNECKVCAVHWCDEYRTHLYQYCKKHAYRHQRYGDPRFTPPNKAQLTNHRKWSLKTLLANKDHPNVKAAQQMLASIVESLRSNIDSNVRIQSERLSSGFDTFKALQIIFTHWLWARECLFNSIHNKKSELDVRSKLIGRRFLSITKPDLTPSSTACRVFGDLITENLFKTLMALMSLVDESKKIEQQAKDSAIEFNYPEETLALATKMINQQTKEGKND